MLLAPLGERTPLKRWQVERVVEKIRASVGWPDPTSEYAWLLLGDPEYASGTRPECPEVYRENEDLWRATVETTLLDTVDGERAELSLALAIDMLMPCHWRFDENVRLVLAAIGGDLAPSSAFAACARNLRLVPNRQQLELACVTLRAFCGDSAPHEGDETLMAALGESTPARQWLVASLEKTIRLQLDPPADVRAQLAALGLGPAGGAPGSS